MFITSMYELPFNYSMLEIKGRIKTQQTNRRAFIMDETDEQITIDELNYSYGTYKKQNKNKAPGPDNKEQGDVKSPCKE